MDTGIILIGIVIIALIALYFYNRNKPAPQGTYDDKDLRSDGSIGGGTRAHDDPDLRSSGSIGGGTRGYDSNKVDSGGSIGGQQRTENSRAHQSNGRGINETAGTQRTTTNRTSTLPPLNLPPKEGIVETNQKDYGENEEEQRKASDKFRSGGSFGGSQR